MSKKRERLLRSLFLINHPVKAGKSVRQTAHGVNDAGFIVDPSEKETNLRRYLLKNAAVSVFLCDGSKFGRSSIFNIAPLHQVDYLVTNAGPHVRDAEVRRRIIVV